MTALRERWDVVVLGAGVIGVATAYWAQRAGLSVALVDRRAGPALETSFANGGQISVSHAGPWANPRALAQTARWLLDENAPFRLNLRPNARQWRWLAAFARECGADRARFNAIQAVRLAAYSRDQLTALQDAEPLTYARARTGIIHVYRDARTYHDALPLAALMRAHGCRRDALDLDAMVAREPALAAAAPQLAGATFTHGDESGDAHAFANALADRVLSRGATAHYGAVALGLEKEGARVTGVVVRRDGKQTVLRARHVVVSLGLWSRDFLRPQGVDLPIYPVKGCSVTIPVRDHDVAPRIAVIDDEHKLVYARLGDRLRVAGMAEVGGYDPRVDPRRIDQILHQVRALFPHAGDFEHATSWAGLRPMTPSSLPFIQRSPRHENLWLNTGHGALGWTMAAGSGRIVADLITGRAPELDYRRRPA